MRILILQAHPRPSYSIVQRQLTFAASSVPGVTVHDLYAAYPDFGIDSAHEKALLEQHDLIVLQHPFYWYSAPAMIKEWLDIVLDFGWAYGPGGNRLHGKHMMQAISTGGPESYYTPKGRNRFTIEHLLSPFNQTAHLCGMSYLKPFVVYEGRNLDEATIHHKVNAYRNLLDDFVTGTLKPEKRLAQGYALPANFKQGATP